MLSSSSEHLTYTIGESLTSRQWPRRGRRLRTCGSSQAIGEVRNKSRCIGNRKLERLRTPASTPDAQIHKAAI